MGKVYPLFSGRRPENFGFWYAIFANLWPFPLVFFKNFAFLDVKNTFKVYQHPFVGRFWVIFGYIYILSLLGAEGTEDFFPVPATPPPHPGGGGEGPASPVSTASPFFPAPAQLPPSPGVLKLSYEKNTWLLDALVKV